MPRCESISRRDKIWLPMHAKDIASLAVTVLLCLPSLTGGAALLINLLLYQSIEQWEENSSAFVALGVWAGIPLVATAAIIGGITALSSSVSVKVKRVQLFVVCLAAVATCCLLFRFGK